MRGRIQKKGKNWYIVLEIGEGARHQKWLSARKELSLNRPAKKYEAEQLLVDKLKDMQEGKYFEPTNATVKEYLETWLKVYCKPNLRQSTYNMNSSLIRNHLVPALGEIKLKNLRSGHIQTMLAERAEKLKSGTVQKIHRVMKQSLSHAVKWEYISRNVADAVVPPAGKKPKMESWTKDEAKHFLKQIKKHRLYAFYLLALTTGMRRGELLGLRWIDINFTSHQITIRQAMMQTNSGGEIDSTKTAAGNRTLDVSPVVLAELQRHKKAQAQELLILGRPGLDLGLVFTNQKGKPYNPTFISGAFPRLIKNMDVKKISLHGLRHTYATMLLEVGINPKVVSERLGHKGIAITLDIYSHVMPQISKEVATKTDDLML